MCGAIENREACVSVIATFGCKYVGSWGMDRVELFRGEEAVGEDESNRFDINGLVEDQGGVCSHGTAGGLFGHEDAFRSKFLYLGVAVACGSALVAKGFVGVQHRLGWDSNVVSSLGVLEEDLFSDIA
jgi:hypothetical protein